MYYKQTTLQEDDIIIVKGNKTLTGEVYISGAKNSVLKLIAASILSKDECIIKNVPYISDIDIMVQVLKFLGAKITRNNHDLIINTKSVDKVEAPYILVSKMRASIAVLGPLISRFGKAKVAMPGGCQIGARKIDMHLMGLQKMGVEFDIGHGYLQASTPNGLYGANITLSFASVGATENILMTAVCAKGTTIINNAAQEPEISDLCNFLNKMGAEISGIGTNLLTINGKDINNFHSCTHTTIGDRIEAGTFLAGGAASGGPLKICKINPNYLSNPIRKLEAMGVDIHCGKDYITVKRDLKKDLKNIDVQTLPYPGFPTDLQAQFMLLCSLAKGKSTITENVFENRFMFAAEIMRMGASIYIEQHHAVIEGPTKLTGAPVSSTDLRAGASLVLAGIMAQGTTIVTKVGHIDRGYEFFCEKLCKLGADVKRISKQEFIDSKISKNILI